MSETRNHVLAFFALLRFSLNILYCVMARTANCFSVVVAGDFVNEKHHLTAKAVLCGLNNEVLIYPMFRAKSP